MAKQPITSKKAWMEDDTIRLYIPAAGIFSS